MLEYDRIDILEGIDAHQKNMIFLTIGILKILVLSANKSLQSLSWFNAKSFEF